MLAWSEDEEELRLIRNDVGSQLALMECKPRHNTVDVPTLFWAGIPGNEADFPAEESFYTFIEQADPAASLDHNTVPEGSRTSSKCSIAERHPFMCSMTERRPFGRRLAEHLRTVPSSAP